jgi:hypothetical protein
MEELILTDPVTEPAKTTSTYHVTVLTLNWIAVVPPETESGLIIIEVRDNQNVTSTFRYVGLEAQNLIKFLNTANLSLKSLHKRILEKLSNDGYLPGTVTGAPDGATPLTEEPS